MRRRAALAPMVSNALAPTSRISRARPYAEAALLAIAFVAMAAWNLGTPGLYMDSVNPDYMAVMLAHPPGHVPAWLLPDNALQSGRHFPLLSSMYGGTLPAYLGHVVWSITDYTLASVRGLHVTYGVAVVIFTFVAARAWASPGAALAAGLILAALPAFWVAWRTQFYLQLFPHLFFLPALAITQGRLAGPATHSSSRWGVVAGVLFGLAAWSYFIFAVYFAATFATMAWLLRARPPTLRFLFAGFALGYLPFTFGHGSILWQAGWSEYVRLLGGLQSTYGVLDGQSSGLAIRVTTTLERLGHIVTGSAVRQTVFGEPLPSSLLPMLAGGLVLLPAALLAWPRHRRAELQASTPRYSLLLAPVLVHLMLALVLGPSMLRQHYFPLLPLLVLTASAVLSNLAPTIRMVAVILILAMLVGSSANLHSSLRATGGRGFYSDVINRTAEIVRSKPEGTVLLFPQWGYWMGVVLLTGGDYRSTEAASLETLPSLANAASGQRFVLVAPVYEPGALNLHFENATGIKADRTIAAAGIRATDAMEGRTIAQRLRLELVDERVIVGTSSVDRVLVVDLIKDSKAGSDNDFAK